MQGQWSHEEAYYRCRFPQEYALANRVEHPSHVYLREKWMIGPVGNWLAKIFLPQRLDESIDLLAAKALEEHADTAAASAVRARIADCDAKLSTHRAALEAGADPTLVTRWIAQARRSRAEADLRVAGSGARGSESRMSRDEIAGLVRPISDLAAVIHQAEPAGKIEIYRAFDLRFAYRPGDTTLQAAIHLDPHENNKSPRFAKNRGDLVGVRGGT